MHRMIKSIRRRLNATTVIAVFALVFAMTGGAYAAKKLIITSTGQISPKVLKSLKGNAGAKGANGANGAPGAQGPAGPAGPAGPGGTAGANGNDGKEGPPGKEGKEGKEGSPWTAGGVLPSGKTETGAWASSLAPESGVQAFIPISFTIPLAEALESEDVFLDLESIEEGKEAEFEEKCPGSVETPLATKGNLCVYTSLHNNLTNAAGAGIVEPSAPGVRGAGTSGALLRFAPEEASSGGAASGTWAVTAP
jgi:hypothetical protein